MQFVKVKNTAGGVKTVFDPSGKQHYIAAGDTATLRPDLADLFLRTHEECQKVNIGGVQRDAEVVSNSTVWIANMTGNPDSAKKVTEKFFDPQTKRWSPTEVENPLHAPKPVVRTMGGGQEEYMDKAGQVMARNLGSTTYTIDPFQRVEVPKRVASWMIKRNTASTQSGSILVSRAPTELDNAIHGWDVAKIGALVKYIDPLCKKAVNTRERFVAAHKGRNKLDDEALDLKVYNERELWIKRAFFRLADPKYDIPTLYQFEEWYRSQGGDAEESA